MDVIRSISPTPEERVEKAAGEIKDAILKLQPGDTLHVRRFDYASDPSRSPFVVTVREYHPERASIFGDE